MFDHPSSHIFEPFRYKTLEDLKSELKRLNIPLPISTNTDILKEALQLRDISIPNRLSIQPMEGVDAKINGSPSDLTFRRYERYARGGAGLIWFEATAISSNCQSNSHQLMISEENVRKFKKLTDITRTNCNETLKSLGFNDSCCLILQLNHSGRYSKREGKKYPIRAFHDLELDNAIGVPDTEGIFISDEKISEIEDIWVEKSILAKQAGFDGVDIKACHGYLISELLASHTRQDSSYGGKSLDNRFRLLLNIISRVQKEVKKDFIVTSRIGIYDGKSFPKGFGTKPAENEQFPAAVDLSEPVELIHKLYQEGVRMLNISVGNPHFTPHLTRPYDQAIKGGLLPKEHPLFSVYRLIYLTSVIKSSIPLSMKVIGSGYSYLRQFAGFLAAGVIQKGMADICGFGRMAFANPNFPKQIFKEKEIDKTKTCISCSQCSQFMQEGKSTGCNIRDSEYKHRN